jgi:hypothetical protein
MEHITLGKFSEKHINHLLQESPAISDFSARIYFLSKEFLDVPYKESTLIGDGNTDEVLVINLEEVDCFTFLEYVEALRISKSFSEFKENLVKVRYQFGEIAFEKRNHFFTDWKEFNSEFIDNVTEDIAEGKSKRITKNLNEKDDESHFLPGVPCRKQEIAYIPSSVIDERISGKLRTGDYAGIYSERKGLDVSHVGILIRNNNAVFIRHASSSHGKVVDEDFQKYVSDKPGIIVLRPGRF